MLLYNVVCEKLRNAMGYKKMMFMLRQNQVLKLESLVSVNVKEFEKVDWFIWMIGRTRRLSPCCAYIRALIYVYIHECTVIFYIKYI